MRRYELYEAAVQDAPSEAALLDRIYREANGRPARRLREDFCGTFWLGYEWVRRHKENRALGTDLDFDALADGFRRHASSSGLQGSTRTSLYCGDVRTSPKLATDIVFAGNFSYFVFKERSQLLEYFRNARESLAPSGLLILDHFGGADIHEASTELSRRDSDRFGRFEMSWRQSAFDEFTASSRFTLKARPRNEKRWTTLGVYDWRLWSIPEIKDALAECGFTRVSVYWQKDNGHFARREKSEANCLKWLAYIVAARN